MANFSQAYSSPPLHYPTSIIAIDISPLPLTLRRFPVKGDVAAIQASQILHRYDNNTPFCSELKRRHSGENCMPLQLIFLDMGL